ncbi:hypothetical protein ACFLUW_00985 [Chloroflexota bacterium]
MLKIDLVPALSRCIETVAKKEYDEAVRQLLAIEEGNEELHERAELLRSLLETTDFRRLRSESERYLVEGRRVKFVVYFEGRVTKCDMQVSSEI